MDKRIPLRFTTDCNGRHLAFQGRHSITVTGRDTGCVSRWWRVSMDQAIEWLTTDRAYIHAL